MRKKFATATILLSLFSMAITACHSYDIDDSTDQGDKQQSETDEKNSTPCLLTGNGAPSNDLGKKDDSYIDLLDWDFYVKNSTEWVLKGNIKGEKGEDGKQGEDGQTPEITIGDNGNWFINGIDTNIKAQGQQGEQGQTGENGVSVISIEKTSNEGLVDTYTITYSDNSTSTFKVTNGEVGEQGVKGDSGKDGHTPVITIGNNGNWFVDGNDTGVLAQGLKGDTGEQGPKGEDGSDGNDGVSVTDAFIDENGDLIIELSNGETTNAGHVKNVDEYTVNFYCNDMLVDTQNVKHGEKVNDPTLEDFIVADWFIDKNLTKKWVTYGYYVTEDMNLYADFIPKIKNVSFDKNDSIEVDENGFGFTIKSEKEICSSKGITDNDFLTSLENRGIFFNKEEIGLFGNVDINIDDFGFESAKIYYGDTPLSFDDSKDLHSGLNNVDLNNAKYFTIQNTGENVLNINSISINYGVNTVFDINEIPTVIINTNNQQVITSRTTYVKCTISTVGADKDVTDLKAEIKVRGNSTASLPKKPYRIKLDKKNSLFGYTKAKNWVLLADYMDGSNMHNYTALKFAKMVRGEGSFAVDPLHVNVILNGENIGLYLFGEHIDAKEGRLNIEQENIWEKDFNDINFYIERDLSTVQDSTEIEGVTYFRVNIENYSPSQYVFALKYPEKEDFEEELEGGEIDTHEEEFQSFFNSLKNYMTNICNLFADYSSDKSQFTNLSAEVDVESLAEYAATDQAFYEMDHSTKSFKMYKRCGDLLKFGPNWDYDSTSFALPFTGMYVLNPFTQSVTSTFKLTYFFENWGYELFKDTINGRPLFRNVWDRISESQLSFYIHEQIQEMNRISNFALYDCGKWMRNRYFCLFDNALYFDKYINTQLPFLKTLYSN